MTTLKKIALGSTTLVLALGLLSSWASASEVTGTLSSGGATTVNSTGTGTISGGVNGGTLTGGVGGGNTSGGTLSGGVGNTLSGGVSGSDNYGGRRITGGGGGGSSNNNGGLGGADLPNDGQVLGASIAQAAPAFPNTGFAPEQAGTRGVVAIAVSTAVLLLSAFPFLKRRVQ